MIDYNLLDKSIKHYNSLGYERIESPWTVTPYIDDITRPSGVTPFELKHNGKRLVASGEQSFLYLYLKGFLPKGKYQTVTPCYRFEAFDYLHTKYFIKNELIITDDVNQNTVINVVNDAKNFFTKFFNEKDINLIQTKEGFDIEVNEIELGSYGMRTCEFLTWIYGTGCAEPRLTNAINKYGIS